MKYTLALIFISLFIQNINAQISFTNKFLDPTFHTIGYDTVNPPIGMNRVIPLSNGKILVGANNKIIRYNNNGLIDSTYGVNGIATSTSSNAYVTIENQSNGKTVMLKDGRLERYDANGNLDISFGTSGGTDIDSMFLNGNYKKSTLNILNNDKLIVGMCRISQPFSNYLLSFNSNGNIDLSFNSIGYINSSSLFPIDDTFRLQAIATNNINNNIIAVYNKYGFGSTNFYADSILVAKINSSGTLISSFGNNGITKMYGAETRINNALFINNDLYLVGSWDGGTNWPSPKVFKMQNNGLLDPAFIQNFYMESTEGVKVIDYNLNDILLISSSEILGVENTILCLNKYSGKIDSTFGEFGVMQNAITSFSFPYLENKLFSYKDVALQITDKKIITVGGLCKSSGLPQNSYIARFDTIGCSGLTTPIITLASTSISCNQTGFQYQWLSCSDAGFAIISGATSQSYSPTTGGNYAVVATNGICSDTSACVIFTPNPIQDISKLNIKVYPNPISNELNVDFVSNTSSNYKFELLNIVGQKINLPRTNIPTFNKIVFNTETLLQGIYILKISNIKTGNEYTALITKE